jgi:DNA gyrase inhibitor GyrI
MTGTDVRIIELPPMRVATTLAFGPNPEIEAWEKLMKWARANGAFTDRSRFFGFNNPNPVPGSPNYGYEQWMTVDGDAEADGDVQINEFDGGLFAVLRCQGLATIGADWGRLVSWIEASAHDMEDRPCLEELLTSPELPHDQYVFDLYLPIAPS